MWVTDLSIIFFFSAAAKKSKGTSAATSETLASKKESKALEESKDAEMPLTKESSVVPVTKEGAEMPLTMEGADVPLTKEEGKVVSKESSKKDKQTVVNALLGPLEKEDLIKLLNERDQRTLLLKDLPIEIQEDALMKLSKDIQHVHIHIQVESDPFKIACYAFLEFENEAAAEKNFKSLSETVLKGKPLTVDYTGKKSLHRPKEPKILKELDIMKLYITGFPYTTTEIELKQLFPKAESLVMPIKWNTQRPLGFAFVKFEDADVCAEVMKQMNGKSFKGGKLVVVYANLVTNSQISKGTKRKTETAPATAKKIKAMPAATSEVPASKKESKALEETKDAEIPLTKEGTEMPLTKEGADVPLTKEDTEVPLTMEDTEMPLTKEHAEMPPTKEGTKVPLTKEEDKVFPKETLKTDKQATVIDALEKEVKRKILNKRNQQNLFLKDVPIQVPGTKRQTEIPSVIRLLLLSTLFFFFSSLHTLISQHR
ncbi:unnamed protein product [Acanthosepion pharaonis]|uniref:RRM domain-containing protein n=1 Tax=Acanthosepion pharaonis TaxID=158019 RepID=A0A812BT12_ACAPH|nr:unnamed protein product [Sepia pharaonis]